MVNQLSRLFNVRRDEFRRLFIISIMMVFFIVGYVWASITIIADFINNLPDEANSSIAYLLIGDALIIIVTFAIYSAFADRFSNNRIMAGLTAFGMVGILAGTYLLSDSTWRDTIFPALFLYLVFRSVGEAISTHWGPLVNDYFDTRAAKRIFTLLAAVTRVSYLIGSLGVWLLREFNITIPLLNDTGNINIGLIELGMFIWFVTLIGMFAMSISMTRLMQVTPNAVVTTQGKENQRSYFQNLYEGYQFAFRSPYLRAFVIVSIFMMVMQALMQFEILRYLNEYASVAPNAGDTDDFISSFLSNIIIWGSIILLPFQLFFFVKLVAWAGVERVNLIFPTTTLIAAVAIAIIPIYYIQSENPLVINPVAVVIWILVLAEFNRTVLNIGIRAVNDEFLYNAVPVRVKGRIRAFISGIVEPFGTLIVGAFLLYPTVTTELWIVPSLMVVIGIGYVLGSAWVSMQYGRALISMIEEENFSFMLQANNRIAFDNDTLQSLEQRFRQAPDDDTRLLMARLLIEARGTAYLPLLLKAADNGSKYLRAGIIDTFISSDLRSPQVIDMCAKYIVDSDATVRKSAITGLKELVGVQSDRYLLAALELLNDNDPSLVAEVLPDLINTRDFYFLQHATQTLNELLEHDDPQQRAIGVKILGDTNSPRVLLLLLRYIIDRSQVVRLQSVIAIEQLSSNVQVTDELVQALSMTISSLLRDPLDRIRRSAVRILANLHPTDFAERIMPALLDDNLEVRELAAQLLIAQPNATTKTFVPLLDSGHGLMSRMTTSVLVRINRNKYEDRIYAHIDDILSTMYTNISRVVALEPMKQYPIIEVVESIIVEENHKSLDEIFYLLGSVHGMEDVSIAVDALKSTVPRTRANGIEAIDVMLNLHLLTGIEKITNPDVPLTELHDYGQSTYNTIDYTAKQVINELIDQHNEDWKVYIGIEALGDLGKQLYKSQSAPEQSPLDLLSALGGADNTPSPNSVDNIPFTLEEIKALLNSLQGELLLALRTALRKARNAIQGIEFERSDQSIGDVISEVERIIFLKRVHFFHDITIDQLRKVATVCHEVWFDADETIFKEADVGGSLYVIVEGRIGIERTQDDGKTARLNTLTSEDSFGEDTLFDESRHTTSAISLSRSLVLRLDNTDLMGLIQSYPEMSMHIIRVLSEQIRQIDRRITSMAKQESKAESLFDKLGI